MNKKIILIILLIVAVVAGLYFWKYSPEQEYKTREECEQQTGQACLISFGDHVLPSGFTEKIKTWWCLRKIPPGWFPESKHQNCEWEIK